MYDDMTIVHWIPQTIIAGVIVISLVARVGIVEYNDTKVEKSIENTITANYDNITNYHNDENNKTFISSNSKYTFEYNENTKMLVVRKKEKNKMGLNYVVIDIIFGVILTFFVGVGCYKAYYNGTSDHWIDHWIPQTIISGLIIISISVGLGIIDDTNMRIEKSIKNTITANYDDVLNYHNEDDNKTFASGDSRYTFDYDKKN